MANVLSVPLSGNIYFDGGSPDTTIPNLTSSAVSLGYDGCAGLTITSYNALSGDRFTVAGESGSLFSVNDSLTGTIFSVNDASGLPIIEVNSNEVTDTVTIGEFGTNAIFVSAGNVGIGTTDLGAKLTVAGNINATSQLLSSGTDINSILGGQVEQYLVDDGINMITSSSGSATPNAANGRSQKFELTENTTLSAPANLADGQSMLITVQQGAGPYSLSVPSYIVMGAGVASDIVSLATGEYAWLSISRYGSDYLISITTE